jgi:hypothetical protein
VRLDWKLYLLSVCNTNVSVTRWPSAFNMQYPSYHPILDFYSQKYPNCFAIVN